MINKERWSTKRSGPHREVSNKQTGQVQGKSDEMDYNQSPSTGLKTKCISVGDHESDGPHGEISR